MKRIVKPEFAPYVEKHPVDEADIAAVNALYDGVASPSQQARVADLIVNKLAGVYDLSFKNGPDGARNTDFSEGKRCVGLTFIGLRRLTLSEKIKT